MDYASLFSKSKNISFYSKKLAEGVFSGNYRSAFKGPGLEFDEVRDYVSGDDVRNIDWNVTSRMNAPYSKKYREERELNFYFLVDVSSSINYGIGKNNKKDMVVAISSLLAFAASQNNDRVGAVLFSDKIEKWVPATKGRNHILRLVNDLLNVETNGNGSNLGLAISTLYKSMKRRGVCVLISDLKFDCGWKELNLLSKKHDVIVIRIADKSDYELPICGSGLFKDVESNEDVRIFGRSKKLKKEYMDYWSSHFSMWESRCKRRNIKFLTISTDEDPVKALLKHFNKGGIA